MTRPPAPPVFVVGAPRSGTTLLAAMLSAHPAIDCGPETFCLWHWSRLGARRRAALLDPVAWPDPATDFVCGLRLPRGDRPIHESYGLGRDDVRRWLAARPPSVPLLLESLTAQRAQRLGKPRWAEKTPRHLETVALIRATWPEAIIVRVVRDPRDAAVSLTRVPFGSPSLVTNLALLGRLDDASRDFFLADRGSLTLRYEDLLAEPERELRRLCAAIGEPFVPAMIEGRAATARIAADHEWWKGDVTGPLDPSRAGQWRTAMPARVQRFAAYDLARFIGEHGYEPGPAPSRTVALVPAGDALAGRNEELLLALSDAGAAVERPVPRSAIDLARRREVVFVGVGGQLHIDPLGHDLRRATNTVGLAILLAIRRLAGRPVGWVPRLTLLPRRPRDPVERVTGLLLRTFARRLEADAVLAHLGIGGRAPT